MYPSSALLGQNKDEALAVLPVDELIEKADGFAGVFPGNISLCNQPINQKGLSMLILYWPLWYLILKWNFTFLL